MVMRETIGTRHSFVPILKSTDASAISKQMPKRIVKPENSKDVTKIGAEKKPATKAKSASKPVTTPKVDTTALFANFKAAKMVNPEQIEATAC
jgi:hypothetical protein